MDDDARKNLVDLVNILIEAEKQIEKLSPEEQELNAIKMGDIYY